MRALGGTLVVENVRSGGARLQAVVPLQPGLAATQSPPPPSPP